MPNEKDRAIPELVYHLPADDPVLRELVVPADALTRFLASEAKKFGLVSSLFEVTKSTDSRTDFGEDTQRLIIEQRIRGPFKYVSMYQSGLGVALDQWLHDLSDHMQSTAWENLVVLVRWADGALERTWIAWPL